MSNEELAILIRNGDKSKLTELWDGVRGYVAKTARSYMVICDGRYGVEFDDLMQSGFLAMVEAVESYESNEAKFVTWFTYYLKKAFAQATNRLTERQRRDPLHIASSLYAPAPGVEDGETMLQDTISAPDAFEEVESKIYREQLRADLETVLSTISEKCANVLRLHFFDGMELTDIARQRGVSNETISVRKREGLRNMRQKVNTSQGARLKAYIENGTNYYSGMGFGRFINTQESPIESVVLKREKLEKRFFSVPMDEARKCSIWRALDHV